MTTPDDDTDFYARTPAQAVALRAEHWGAPDLDHLAEELESLGRSDRRALTPQLERVLVPRLTWVDQPDQRPRSGRSWRRRMRQARHAVEQLIDESPSLHDAPARQLVSADRYARRRAAEETGLPLTTFPEPCRWPVVPVLDEAVIPEA